MVYYFSAIQSRGSLDGFNTEPPEQLHIDYAKEAYWVSKKKEYVWQMTVWLGRQEAVAQFRAYHDYVIALDPSIPPDNETDEDNLNEMEEPAHTDLSPWPTHSVAVKPAFPYTDFNTLTTDFKAPNFLPALSMFIHRLIPPPVLPILLSRQGASTADCPNKECPCCLGQQQQQAKPEATAH